VWALWEEAELRALRKQGFSLAAIARRLDRSFGSIEGKIRLMNLPRHRKGQPAKVTIKDDIAALLGRPLSRDWRKTCL
jgi:hypothetical protein